MSDINPEHLKYMPHSPEEEERVDTLRDENPEEEVMELVEEEITIIPEVDEKEALREVSDDNISGVAESTARCGESWDLWQPILRGLYDLLSPLTAPTIATIWLFTLSIIRVIAPSAGTAYSITVFGATCLVPLLLYFVLSRIGIVESFSLPQRRQRVYFYIIEFVAFGALTWFFLNKGAAPWVWTLYCGAGVVALANFLINLRFRISNHCSAMAALLAVLIVINRDGVPQHPLLWWVVGTVAAIGYVGTMAMLLGRHSLWEVLAGYATGFLGIILMSLIR